MKSLTMLTPPITGGHDKITELKTDTCSSRAPNRSLKACNVASQPKYSPLRYPGGKTWLAPQIRSWLNEQRTTLLVEPFAGGATASLVAVLEGYVERSVVVERDPYVAAVWTTILSDDADWLIERILSFEFNVRNVMTVLKGKPRTTRRIAFQAIVKNRARRGGILADSAKLMRKGERGRGIRSRWYPETLARRIALIHAHREYFTLIQGDGLKAIASFSKSPENIRFFVDPPYPTDGHSSRKRLYTYNKLDHRALFNILETMTHDFLMTNDDCRLIRRLATEANFLVTPIKMTNTHGLGRRELLIRPTKTRLRTLGSEISFDAA